MLQPILTVDLTSGGTGSYSIPEEWERDYIGGASLGARLLYEHLDPQVDPLAPEAPLFFLNGPLSGTSGPAVGRFVLVARSPATGLWGESNCGGFWGPELRMAGFDGLWLTGRSPTPVYLLIRDRQVELRPAHHLWGLDTYQTQATIQSECGDQKVRVASIGPAGEKLIPFALVLADHGRVAGRTGMGALMGSKNLKAVAVRGSGKVPVVDRVGYPALRSQANRVLKVDPETQVVHALGTSSIADYMDYLGEMPKRYFQDGVLEGATNISGAAMEESILVGTSACHACVVACGRVVRLEDGENRKGPEYETLVGFGPNLGMIDLAFATRMGELCDRYGMDSISLSNTIGLAFKLYADGIITCNETNGLALLWGDGPVIEQLIHQTARRTGFGECLAEGALALAERYGVGEEAVQVNRLEVPYHDPRGASGMGLVYATSPRGACHNQSDYFMVEIGQAEEELGIEILSRHAGAEKALNVVRHQDWRTLFNSLVVCVLANNAPEMIVSLLNLATGRDYSLRELQLAGERGWNLKRIINFRFGLRKENDKLPKALLKPFPPGGGAGRYVPPIAEMLQAYYKARGWDVETGYPTPEKLDELGLTWSETQ